MINTVNKFSKMYLDTKNYYNSIWVQKNKALMHDLLELNYGFE